MSRESMHESPQAEPPGEPEAAPRPEVPPPATSTNWIALLCLGGSAVVVVGVLVVLLLALGVLHI